MPGSHLFVGDVRVPRRLNADLPDGCQNLNFLDWTQQNGDIKKERVFYEPTF